MTQEGMEAARAYYAFIRRVKRRMRYTFWFGIVSSGMATIGIVRITIPDKLDQNSFILWILAWTFAACFLGLFIPFHSGMEKPIKPTNKAV